MSRFIYDAVIEDEGGSGTVLALVRGDRVTTDDGHEWQVDRVEEAATTQWVGDPSSAVATKRLVCRLVVGE